MCNLRGLSAFSGEPDSLLRCVGGVGEAGASYMNKLFNCNTELFLYTLPGCPLHFGARDQDLIRANQGKRRWMAEGQRRDSIQSFPKKFQQHNEKTIGTISGISHRMDDVW